MRVLSVQVLAVVVAAALLHGSVSAQSAALRVDFSAPNAASLGRFGDVPVHLHTGLPDIAIPLFTVQGRTLELPITLRYHGGGIRVEEVGGWAGLGWSLEAGGTITRTVRGLLDESTSGYLNTGHVFYDGESNWLSPSPAIINNLRNGSLDGEPDLYTFNFAGRSGQFAMGPTTATAGVWQVRTIPHQRFRITPTLSGGQITAWQIIAEDGTKYTFAVRETTTDLSIYSDGSFPDSYSDFHASTWHLTKVRSPGGDEITLHYTPYTAEHKLNGYQESRLPRTGQNCPTQDFEIFGHHRVQAQRLDSITSAVHTVRLTTTLRSDARSPSNQMQEPRLDRISVRTPAGTELRRFQFDHDYFGGNRLRLKNIFEQDAAGTSLPPWTFTYDTQTLPPLTSKAQDHWGFWNGKSNTTLIPRVELANGTVLAGADREPDVIRTRMGSLTRITYPTGGYSEFVWQAHTYGWQPGGSIYGLGPQKSVQLTSNGFEGLKTTPLVIGGSGSVSAQVNVQIEPDGCQPWEPCSNYTRIVGQGTWNSSTSTSITLAPGTYTLEAYSSDWTGYASINVSWQEWVPVKSKAAGGLRIAEIRTADAMGAVQSRKFQYTLAVDPDSSSGVLRARPAYHWSVSTPDCAYTTRASVSKMPLGGGAAITYREVTVLHGASGQFGRTREAFRSFLDQPDGGAGTDWPYHTVTSYDWKRGQRVDLVESNSAGAVQQRTKTGHAFLDNASFTRFRGLSLHVIPSTLTSFAHSHNPYELISGWTYPAVDTTFTYNENGTGGFSTVTAYGYENQTHLQLTRITETNSDGRQRITRMKYPADYASGSGNVEAVALTAMKGDSAHMHSHVIERWVTEKLGTTEKVVQADLTSYRAVTGRYLPYHRFTLNATAPPTNFVVSTVSGSFTKDSRYLRQETANSYDGFGRITQLADAHGKLTNYTYGGNPKSAFLTKVTRVKDATGSMDLVTDLAYNSSGYLSSIRDEGGTFRRFTYDAHGRLSQVRNHGSTLVEAYAYLYSRTSANGWVYQASAPNRVTTTTYLGGQSVVTREYLDGLGRPIQTNVQDGSNYHVTATQYDLMGRPWRVWKPYPRTSLAYDAGFAANATSHYNTYLGVANAKPYADTEYTPDPLSRLKKEIPEYTGTSATAFRQYAYSTNAAARQVLTEVTDELGKKRRTHTDLFGQEVRIVLGAGSADSTATALVHDVAGRRTQATDPRNIVTTYTLDTRGLLTTRANPDAGNRSHKYDRAGNLRYTQDANQAAAGQVLFTNYDFAGRPLVTGVGVATFSSLDPNATASFEGTQASWRTVRKYDGKPTDIHPWSLFWTQINPLTLRNVGGRVAGIASQSGGAWQATLFSYDTDGRVVKRYTYTESSGTAGQVLAAVSLADSLVLNLQGAPTERRLTVGSSPFNHWYEYDGRGLLWKVFAGTGTKPASPDVTYTYRPSSSPASRQFLGGPVVPVTYTIREQLHRIGDPAGTLYPFSARYLYHPNGTISQSEFYNAGTPTGAGATKRYRYVYGTASYDALNRLKSADFSSWSGSSWTSTLAHDLTTIAYDRAGNLTTLRRYKENATLIDNLTYTTPTSSNRLGSIADAVSTTPETWDAETGSFTYDPSGNMTTSPAPYSITAATYDPMNLPLSLTRAGVTSAYRYDHDAQRITKRVGAGNTEVYLRDGPVTLAVFTVNGSGTLVSSYFNLLSGTRVVGRQPTGAARRYYHTDLLGSTRTVVQGASVVEAYDYDPWGVLMPGRTLGSGTKEGFTGKERDAETGLDYFGFRYYMAAVGRWTSVDPPADSFPSWNPYNYVEGNPISYWDPFGLSAEDSECGGFLRCVGQFFTNQWSGFTTPLDQGPPEGGSAGWAAGRLVLPLATAGTSARLAAGARAAELAATAEMSGVLRAAASGKGNFGVGSVTAQAADDLGRAWVGQGFTVASDGRTLVSANGLRQYRPPTFKPNEGTVQSNLEWRLRPGGAWQGNAHLNITGIY